MTNKREDTPLTGGGRTAVVRRGGTVLRETGPWAPTVHSLLRHLEKVDFEGAPRVVGTGFDEQGREILTYMEGDVINPAQWTDDGIIGLGALVRRLHDATASYQVPIGAIWRPWFGRDIGVTDVIGHGDVAPWNIISRRGQPAGLIDWESQVQWIGSQSSPWRRGPTPNSTTTMLRP